jgi:hypothetical protein
MQLQRDKACIPGTHHYQKAGRVANLNLPFRAFLGLEQFASDIAWRAFSLAGSMESALRLSVPSSDACSNEAQSSKHSNIMPHPLGPAEELRIVVY